MALFAVNQALPGASKSWFLRKTCRSSIDSKSPSHNHCAEVLGALYDNVRLVAGSTAGSSAAPLSSAPPSGVGQTDRAMNLVTQCSAATLLILVQGVRRSDA